MAIGSGSEAAQSELQDKYHKVRLQIPKIHILLLETHFGTLLIIFYSK